jgi:hypothetical protein
MGPILDTIRTFSSQIQVTIAKKFFLIDSDAIICSRNTFGGISKPVFESYQLYLLKVHIPDFRLDKSFFMYSFGSLKLVLRAWQNNLIG